MTAGFLRGVGHSSGITWLSIRRLGDIAQGKREKGFKAKAFEEERGRTPEQFRVAMNWTKRLKRVLGIDIETSPARGGVLRIAAPCASWARGITASQHVIAWIEGPAAMKTIPTYFEAKKFLPPQYPPDCRLFGFHRPPACSAEPPTADSHVRL